MSNYDWNDREDGWHEDPLIPKPVRILTREGMLCASCGERFLERQRAKALEQVQREGISVRKPVHVLAAQARAEEE